MKIGKFNFLFEYKGKFYEEMDDMIATMSYEELREKEESLRKILKVMGEKRRAKEKEMQKSKVLMVASGILLVAAPFFPSPILKFSVMGLSLTSIGGAVVSYKTEKYQRQMLTLKMLTSKFQQKEILKEMQERLNGKKYFIAKNNVSEKDNDLASIELEKLA